MKKIKFTGLNASGQTHPKIRIGIFSGINMVTAWLLIPCMNGTLHTAAQGMTMTV